VVRDAADKVASEIAAGGGQARAYVIDVSDFAAVQQLCEQIGADLGGIDILVNNAGITRDNLLLRMTEAEFDRVVAVNLKGAFNFTKACFRGMIKNRWGRIVNIASIIGQMGNAGQANYAAAKAGLIGFTKSAARELASRNVTVNAIAPGYIATAMTEKLSAAERETYVAAIPLKRVGTPEDVANVCLFLASEQAGYITGQVLRVDGGLLM
jgi:3-oxoacyl-[acyl-carrier protein] reductase